MCVLRCNPVKFCLVIHSTRKWSCSWGGLQNALCFLRWRIYEKRLPPLQCLSACLNVCSSTWNSSGLSAQISWHSVLNPLNPELNPICYLLALLGAHHFLHVSRIRVKSLTFRLLTSYIYIYIYGAPILDVSRSHTTTQHSR